METRSTPAFWKIQRYHHQHHDADFWRNQLFKFASSSFFLKNLSPIKSNFLIRFQCVSITLVALREINQPPAGIFFVMRKGWPRIPSSQKAQVSTTCCSPGCQLPHSELLSIMIDWTRSAWIRERFIFFCILNLSAISSLSFPWQPPSHWLDQPPLERREKPKGEQKKSFSIHLKFCPKLGLISEYQG